MRQQVRTLAALGGVVRVCTHFFLCRLLVCVRARVVVVVVGLSQENVEGSTLAQGGEEQRGESVQSRLETLDPSLRSEASRSRSRSLAHTVESRARRERVLGKDETDASTARLPSAVVTALAPPLVQSRPLLFADEWSRAGQAKHL